MEQGHWVAAFSPQAARSGCFSNVGVRLEERRAVVTQRKCSLQNKESEAPDDSALRKGDQEGNEMENTDKLEACPRGGV